jgi:hypothetical protein
MYLLSPGKTDDVTLNLMLHKGSRPLLFYVERQALRHKRREKPRADRKQQKLDNYRLQHQGARALQ